MYEISVVSYQGAAPADRIAAVFDADGGTIGRGPGNTLVLPDPNRFVSRLQAKVAIEDGRLAITNASSANPLLVNDRELDAGGSARLADGDELRIGLYLLRVRRVDAGGGDDAADLTQLSMIVAPASPARDKAATNGHKGTANAVPAPPETPAAQPSPTDGVAEGAVNGLGPLDPLQLPIATANSDPFADLIPQASPLGAGGNPAAPPVISTPNSSRGGSAPVVPDDVWNDLARLAASPTPTPSPTLPADFDPFAGPQAAPRNPDDPLAEFAQSGVALDTFDKLDAPIDALFNDASAKPAPDDVIPDPHAAPADPLAAPESVDPIAIFGGDQPPSERFARTEPDQVPELEAWFRPPEPRFAPATQEAPRPHAAVTPAGIAPSREPMTPARMRTPRPPAPPGESAPRSQQAPALSEDALLQAFLAGAGIPNAIVEDGLTPEMMKSIGTMLAAAVQGTIELIATRAMLKREVKADVTLIATTKNNPLKFLPDAESALLQMFGARIPGFMGPVEAMQDAFQDLRAHEVGVIAGMRAALADVLRRFEPGELEKRLKPPGVLESLLPNSHQARLWETFTQMYGDISGEAQDDFQTLFGKAFVAAYENEVARLKGGA